MLGPFALLLDFAGRLLGRDRVLRRASEQACFDQSGGQANVKSAGSARVENGVGMVDVCTREILHRRLQGGQGNDDLCLIR